MGKPRRETVTVALQAPVLKEYGDNQRLWNITVKGKVAPETPGHGKFVIFDQGLVDAFEKEQLAGVEREYIVSIPERPDRSPEIVEIPGVAKKKSGGGGGGGGGGSKPSLTDSQAALFAAVSSVPTGTDDSLIAAIARRFHRLLADLGGGVRSAAEPTAAPQSGGSAPAAAPPTSAKAPSTTQREQLLEEASHLCDELWFDEAKVAGTFGKPTFAELPLSDLVRVVERLREKKAEKVPA